MEDYYRLLGVPEDASPDQIKKTFHRLALKHHPDLNSEEASRSKFAEISQAYNVLSDPKSRAEYDMRRRQPLPGFDSVRSVDPIYETLRRHAQARYTGPRSSFWNSQDEWRENKQHWEQMKREAEGYKLRRQNMYQRMVDAHASRVARGLAGHWPAQYGITRQDVAVVSCFIASLSFLGWFWTGQSVEGVVAPVEPE